MVVRTDGCVLAGANQRPSVGDDRARARAYKTGSGPSRRAYRSGLLEGSTAAALRRNTKEAEAAKAKRRGPQMGPMGNNNNNSPQPTQPP